MHKDANACKCIGCIANDANYNYIFNYNNKNNFNSNINYNFNYDTNCHTEVGGATGPRPPGCGRRDEF